MEHGFSASDLRIGFVQKSDNGSSYRRFAAAAFPNDAQYFSFVQCQVYAVYRRDNAAFGVIIGF